MDAGIPPPPVLMRTKNTSQIQFMITLCKASGMHRESRGNHTFYVFPNTRTRACPYDYCYVTTQSRNGILARRMEYVNEDDVEPIKEPLCLL